MSILSRIRAHGGDVTRDGWRMTLRPGRLGPDAIAWLKRADVKAQLHEEVWPEIGDWHERAAIREFCGGQDRETAEAEAYREVMQC